MEKNEAIIILAHGSRKERVSEEFMKLAGQIQDRLPSIRIEPALFQFSKQDLPEALKKLASEGYNKIKIVPLFLFQGVHIKEDIPEVISGVKGDFPNMDISVSQTLWPDERILDILTLRIEETV